jgi:integrase
VLTIFRRHRKVCSHRGEGRGYRRCQCPISVEGFVSENLVRRSLKTRDWQKAQDTVRQWEAERREPVEQEQPVGISEATEKFLVDAEARKLNESTIYKYRLLLARLKDFAVRHELRFLSDLDVDTLSAFRAEWKDGPRSSLKKLERLRAFFHFAERRKWIESNPARELKAPKITVRPTMPFTHDEVVWVLSATDKYKGKAAHNARLNALRLRALVLLLRYSGMRIGDAVALTLDRIVGNRLFLYTAKTGVPVHILLPDFVVETLRATPPMTDRHYFWTGAGKLQTAVKVWETRLRRLFRLAGIPDGHAHRFRDTFAVELLLEGVPIERVSVLLGHQSIRITERHYAPWVRARQEQVEADLQRVWSRDPLLLLHANHTRDTHGESERPN